MTTRTYSNAETHSAVRYTITLSPNGGALTGSGSVVATLGVALPNPGANPTCVGGNFNGWATQPAGGIFYYDRNGSPLRSCYDIAGPLTLYAQWGAVEGTWYVDGTNGNDSNNGLSWETPKKTIQAAIDASFDGDVIYVADGTYAPITSPNKSITIQSVNGAASTIIDGGGTQRCALMASSTSASTSTNSLVRGFTFLNGFSDNSGGGSVRYGFYEDCVFSNNVAVGQDAGGACWAMLNRCVFRNNQAERQGGAVSSCAAYNCLFIGNSAKDGGAANNSLLNNCTIVGNIATNAASAFNHCIVNNCVVYGNTGAVTNETAASEVRFTALDESGYSGEGCIILTGSPFCDPEEGDYRLRCGSEAFNTGTNGWAYDENCSYVKTFATNAVEMADTDLAGNPRIVHGSVDMGCYEYVAPDAPVVDPPDGTRFWTSAQTVMLSCADPDAKIYYTMDGTDPTTNSTQRTKFNIRDTTTVRAIAIGRDGQYCSNVTTAQLVKVDQAPAISGVEATYGESEDWIRVSWEPDESGQSLSYNIYRALTNDFAEAELLASNLLDSSSPYEDTTPEKGYDYYYWVVGENEVGEGLEGIASIGNRLLPKIAVPVITPGNGHRFGTKSLKVMFSCETEGVAFYYTTDGSDPTTNSPTASAINLTASAIVKVLATKYWMRDSDIVEAEITRVYVADPPVEKAAVETDGNALGLSWSPVDTAETYRIYRGTSPDFEAAALLCTTNEPAFTDTTALAYTNYYYFVLSENLAGVSVPGEPALGALLTLPVSVNQANLSFLTGGDAAWTPVRSEAAHDRAHYAKSGAIDDNKVSWVETTVTGPGSLTFWWRVSCENDPDFDDWDHVEFLIDGTEKARIDGETRWAKFACEVPAGAHTLRWLYFKDAGQGEGDDCAYLDQVSFIPDETKTSFESWVDYYGIGTPNGSNVLSPLPSGKGDTVREEFVAGLNPVDPGARFLADIEATDPIRVDRIPDLGSFRVYTVEGKENLSDESWTSPTNATHRFFRVKVSMPE